MVCEDCEKEKKSSGVIVQDTWKAGAKNTVESGGKKIGENKLLSKKNRFDPLLKKDAGATKKKGIKLQMRCRLCEKQLIEPGNYCNNCAMSKVTQSHKKNLFFSVF